jgi:phosphoserine phosphatase RsbU/P
MLKNRGIAFKLVVFFTLSSAIIFTLIFGYNYYVSRKTIEKNLEEHARTIVTNAMNKIETVLRATQKVPENIAYFLENSSYNEKELVQLIYTVVEKNEEIYGAAIAFEPYAFKKTSQYFAPYFYKPNQWIEFKSIDKYYNYLYSDWYQIPKELKRPQWIEPYFGEGGGIIMSSYSVPFYKKVDGKRQFKGIVIVDVSLEQLRNIVSSIKVLKTGYGFLISKNGTIVTHPLKDLIMNETIFSIAEARNDTRLREIGRKMIHGESGLVPFKSITTGKLCWMYYIPIPSSGWSLAVLFPQDEMIEDITNLNKIVIFLGIFGLFLLSIAVVFIARSITEPLRGMAKATEHIGAGNLDIELPPVKTRDEVGRLSEAFNYMKASLKEYIKELTEATASKERIESELKIAHDIQMGILQKRFPPFPDRDEFDIYATIKPAREVGGDFYDFFFIDDEHLCFVIADVSGKGVPAAFFMALTKTLIKAKATSGLTSDKIILRVNEDLCIGNDLNMFVTVFCGILNTITGEILYTNGGHNPPLLIRDKGDIAFIEGKGELMIGVMEDAAYTTESITLQPGDSLFLYTDGVTEAMNGKSELFSEERLKNEIFKCRGESIQQVIECIMGKIAQFSLEAPQSDDITMMIVQFKGNKGG